VGLAAIGTWFPERWMSAADIAAASGIPEEVIVERFGLDGKHISGPDDHASTMGARAAEIALERAGLSAGDVDVIMYFGSMGKDYYIWSAAPKIQNLIGASRAWALEMSSVSHGCPMALKVGRDLIRSDERIGTMLVVGASVESHFLDYGNPRSRFMFNFGDGAAAAVLQRGEGHEVLESRVITDGRFADAVAIFAGGSRLPASHESVDASRHFFDVPDPEAMKAGLDSISGERFLTVARDVCRAAGLEPSEVALLAPIHFKKSFHDSVVDQLGIDHGRVTYLRRHGHMSGIDPLVGIDMRWDDLSPGDHVLCLAAGTGYSWAATLLRW